MVQFFWNQNKQLKADLNQVKLILAQQRLSQDPYQKSLNQLLRNNGKMLRAGLVIEFGRYLLEKYEVSSSKILPILYQGGAALELLHLATLIHDDVLDSAKLRRGLPTLQTEYDNKIAIYLGDFLFAKYFQILTEIAPNHRFVSYHAQNMEYILQGELIQDCLKFNEEVTLTDYYAAIKGKTATLFQVAAITGFEISLATLSSENQDYEQSLKHHVANFGYHLGMAFQMIDDLQDINPHHRTGKPKFEDLTEGIYTLPIILAMHEDSQFKEQLQHKSLELPDDISRYFDAHPQFLIHGQQIVLDLLKQADEDLVFLGDSEPLNLIHALIRQVKTSI